MRAALLKVLAFLLTLLPALSAHAADRMGDGREADHAALRTLMNRAVQAINSQDMDALSSCFSERFVFTTVDQTAVTSTLALKRYYDRMLRAEDSPLSGFKMEPSVEVPAVFLGANAGYSCGVSDDAYILRKSGRVIHMPSRWTATVVKEEGQWKLAALHAGINFTDNALLKIEKLPWWRKLLLGLGLGKYPGEK